MSDDKSAVLTRIHVRNLHCGHELCGSCETWLDDEIAALRAEIERLTAEVEREHKRATEPPVVTRELVRAREGWDRAEAQRDALLKALREIADLGYTEGNGPVAIGIARAALEGAE